MRDEEISRTERLRIAVSVAAAEVSDLAAQLVPTYADEWESRPAASEYARRVREAAEHLVALAVASDRRRGASWTQVGEALGISRQAAHERYDPLVRELDEAAVIWWLTGRTLTAHGQVPDGYADPVEAAERLTRWVGQHPATAPALPRTDPGDPVAGQPVEAHTSTPTAHDYVALLTVAGALLARLRFDLPPDDPQLAALEVGYARRKTQVYQRMLAEEQDRPGSTGNTTETLADLLAGARARLAEVQAAVGDEVGQRRVRRTPHTERT
ncbi:hypothetical protein [Actinomadura kijaniata]|uniref:hypothetical protein n=1 Tax=Actinomadura kijaniata TaxID=46161 RepID=UPI00082ACB1A|nr:hypothetical protein [Actinomadura kijaniata]